MKRRKKELTTFEKGGKKKVKERRVLLSSFSLVKNKFLIYLNIMIIKLKRLTGKVNKKQLQELNGKKNTLKSRGGNKEFIKNSSK